MPSSLIDGRVDVFRPDRACQRPVTLRIGRPDDLAAADSAAGQQAEHRVAPVVAAGGAHAAGRSAVAAVVHPRRAAELAAENHEGRIEQAPLRQDR